MTDVLASIGTKMDMSSEAAVTSRYIFIYLNLPIIMFQNLINVLVSSFLQKLRYI